MFQQTHSTYSAHVFAKTLDSFNPNRMRNWKKSANIFWKEYVIIPVYTGTHWMFIIVKMNHNDGVSIMILDSANRPSLSSNKYIVHRLTVQLKTICRMNRLPKPYTKETVLFFGEEIYPDVPQQPNDSQRKEILKLQLLHKSTMSTKFVNAIGS